MHAHDPAELVVVIEGGLTAYRDSGDCVEMLELGLGGCVVIPGPPDLSPRRP